MAIHSGSATHNAFTDSSACSDFNSHTMTLLQIKQLIASLSASDDRLQGALHKAIEPNSEGESVLAQYLLYRF